MVYVIIISNTEQLFQQVHLQVTIESKVLLHLPRDSPFLVCIIRDTHLLGGTSYMEAIFFQISILN